MLLACSPAPRVVYAPPPPPVVVTVRDTPPANLTRCPVAPAGFPADGSAEIPAPVRDAIVRLALAYRAVVGQLGRLIAWNVPTAPCAGPTPAVAQPVATPKP